jgi:hypothetical protein
VEKRKGKLRDEARADAVIDTREFLVNLSTKMPTILKEIFREVEKKARSKAKRQLWKPQLSRFQLKSCVMFG